MLYSVLFPHIRRHIWLGRTTSLLDCGPRWRVTPWLAPSLPSGPSHKVSLCICVTATSPGLVHPGSWQSHEPTRAVNITFQDEGFMHLLVLLSMHNVFELLPPKQQGFNASLASTARHAVDLTL